MHGCDGAFRIWLHLLLFLLLQTQRAAPQSVSWSGTGNFLSEEVRSQNFAALSEWHAKLYQDQTNARQLTLGPFASPNRSKDSSLRNPRDYACQTSGRGRVYMQHLRKAGGTSLRFYLGEQSCGNGRELFKFYVQERKVFNSDLLTEPGTLVVTMLRHPISRILSSYFFEGRFTLKQRSRRPENAQSIAGWYDAIDIERRKNAPRRSIWLDVQNYYIQVLSGHRWQRPVARSAANASFDNVEWRADYEKAAAILGAFDVVLVMEWLHCREQSEWLQQRLGLSEAISQARQLNRRTINPARLYAKVNASDLELLYQLNEWDLRLYDHARSITRAQIQTHLPVLLPAPKDLLGQQANSYCDKEAVSQRHAGGASEPPPLPLQKGGSSSSPGGRGDHQDVDCGPAAGTSSIASQHGMEGKPRVAMRCGRHGNMSAISEESKKHKRHMHAKGSSISTKHAAVGAPVVERQRQRSALNSKE